VMGKCLTAGSTGRRVVADLGCTGAYVEGLGLCVVRFNASLFQ